MDSHVCSSRSAVADVPGSSAAAVWVGPVRRISSVLPAASSGVDDRDLSVGLVAFADSQTPVSPRPGSAPSADSASHAVLGSQGDHRPFARSVLGDLLVYRFRTSPEVAGTVHGRTPPSTACVGVARLLDDQGSSPLSYFTWTQCCCRKVCSRPGTPADGRRPIVASEQQAINDRRRG